MFEKFRARMIRWFEDPGETLPAHVEERSDFEQRLSRRAAAIVYERQRREYPRMVCGGDMVPPEVREETRRREWMEQIEIGRQTFARMQERERRAHAVLTARVKWWPW